MTVYRITRSLPVRSDGKPFLRLGCYEPSVDNMDAPESDGDFSIIPLTQKVNDPYAFGELWGKEGPVFHNEDYITTKKDEFKFGGLADSVEVPIDPKEAVIIYWAYCQERNIHL